MKRLHLTLLALSLLCAGQGLSAQKQRTPYLATNLLDWAYIGGINISAGVDLSQHLTVELGGVYSPFTISQKGNELKNKQTTISATLKYWPWYVCSGWWFAARARFSDYSKTPFVRNTVEDGKAVGAGLSLGYALMLNEKFSLDFGFGLWGGMKFDQEVRDRRPERNLLESGSKAFIDADKLSVSLIYLF